MPHGHRNDSFIRNGIAFGVGVLIFNDFSLFELLLSGAWAYTSDFRPASRITIRGVLVVAACVLVLILLALMADGG